MNAANKPAEPFTSVSAEALAFLGTAPVPAAAYHDPAWFELEREAVFRRSWLYIGHVCELPAPGAFVGREVEEAAGKRATFSCPYHMWTFGTDGALISAPDFVAFGLAKADCALKQVRLEVCAGMLFVCFSGSTPPLREWLGDLAGQMETLPVAHATCFSEYTYDIAANWKLTYDNFQENYHLRFIHPRSGEAAFAAQNPFGYPKDYAFHGQHRTQTIWSNPGAQAKPHQAIGFGGLMPGAMARDILSTPYGRQYFALFPSFFMLGTPLQNFVHQVWPIDAGHSRGVIRIYWVGEDRTASERFGREMVLTTVRDVHAEDLSVIEAGQRGLESGALGHIHFQTQEALCRHLYNSVAEAVEAYRTELAS